MKKAISLFAMLAFCASLFSQTQTKDGKPGEVPDAQKPPIAAASMTGTIKALPSTPTTVYVVRDTVPNIMLVSNASGQAVWQMNGYSVVQAASGDAELKQLSGWTTIGYLDANRVPLVPDIIIWSERLLKKP